MLFWVSAPPDFDFLRRFSGKLKQGDELILHDIFGTINYHGEGTFIAGGAGITPFLAILRQLKKDQLLGDNHLLFSNKTAADIILKEELSQMLGKNLINTLTEEITTEYDHARIDEKAMRLINRSCGVLVVGCGAAVLIHLALKFR